MKKSKCLFVFGLGYSAGYFARALAEEGWTIFGTAREAKSVAALRAQGFGAFEFSRQTALSDGKSALVSASHVLVSVPPDDIGDPVFDAHADDIAGANVSWLGYLSTTGVYGNTDGAWVGEDAATKPESTRGTRRVDAETRWLGLWKRQDVPVHIFRLAGIYGPGRSILDQLRAGRAHRIDKPGHVFSRIHVEDIVGVLRASMERPNAGAIYNVCDEAPAAQRDVVEYAASLLGIDPPPLVLFEDANLSAMGRSFYADNRRVKNDRIKDELGVRLKYPDYKTGLSSIAADN